MSIDTREARIIFQNALAHATNIAKHNAKDRDITVEEVVNLAKQIAREVVQIGIKKES